MKVCWLPARPAVTSPRSLTHTADEFEPDEAEQAEEAADVQQALQQEEEAVRERLKQASKGPVKTQYLESKPAIVEPVAAPKKHLIAPPVGGALRAQKTARLEELRKVIKLRDSGEMLLYDASPLTAYELHTRHQSRRGSAELAPCPNLEARLACG